MNERVLAFALSAGVLIAVNGCARSTERAGAQVSVTPVVQSSPPPQRAEPRFAQVTSASGLAYRWSIAGPRPLNILQTIGNGCAMLDYDQDGNLDVLLVGPRLALYRGDGAGHFTDVTQETGLDKLHGHFLGCAVGDYDNDGFPDIYISGYRTGILLHNEPGSREVADRTPPAQRQTRHFRDVTAETGLEPQPWGTSAAWVDVDGDGYLDLYICNYAEFDPHTDLVLCKEKGIPTSCSPLDYDAAPGVLYRNEGGHRFRDVTSAWGAESHGKDLGVAPADYDLTGRPSLAIANDLVEGDLLHNLGRRLRNVARQAGVAGDEQGEEHAGMGIDWGDYDNDGRLDLFVTTFSNEVKCLYHNDGYGVFHVASADAGIEKATDPYVAWGCKFLDADNDGWLDLLVANGHVQDNIRRFERMTYRQPLLFLHNMGGRPPRFEDGTVESGLNGLRPIVGRGLAVGDYDSDGKIDALAVDSEGPPLLLHNEAVTGSNQWIGFRLIGAGTSSRDAYGAVITVRAGDMRLVRQCQSAGSYLSSSDARVHFGLGTLALGSVTVHWPDGQAYTWTNLQPDRYYTLREGSPTPQ